MSESQRRGLLSEDEREAADLFVFEQDRVRYVVAHSALRALLGDHVGRDPRGLRFARTHRGKPYLIDESVRFNLSHSGNYVVVGICESSEIGVDTEQMRADFEFHDIAARYFSLTEFAWLMDASDDERRERFYRLWVVKEAFLKATGEGLGTPLNQIVVEFACVGPLLPRALAWSAEESRLIPDHRTAVVVASGCRVCWHAEPLSCL
jgi:4'-phosphopantetheinyl transferase